MSEPKTSVLDNFFLKLGTVLSMTKDALLADFLGDLPSYSPDLQALMDANDREGFKKALGKTGSQLKLTGFIECIFRRLGYDLTSYEGNKELVDLVTSIFSTAESLGDSVAQLADEGLSWKEVESIAKANQPEGEGKKDGFLTPEDLFNTPDGNSIFSIDDGKGNSFSVGIGDLGDGKLSAIANISMDLFNLIKKFRDLEWSKIETEHKDFINFLNDNYFTKEFAERLFDHILVVLLSKAREVFDEEIREIARNIDQFRDSVLDALEQAAQELGIDVNELIRQIKDLLEQIEKVKKQIEEEAKNLYEQAKTAYEEAKEEFLSTVEDYYDQVSGELQALYRMLENKLLALMKTSLGAFGTLGDLLDRIYHVLDFFGLIRKQNIEIARYVPVNTVASATGIMVGGVAAATMTVADLLNAANPVTPLTGEIDTERLQGLDEDADAAVKELKSRIPTVEIYVIRWSRLEQLFTSPESYFKEVFPLHDYDDAEALVIRLAGLVRSFNPDIPDFSSITAILNDLLVRLTKTLQEAGNAISDDVKKKIDAVRDFILEVKRVLEAYATLFKQKLSEAYDRVLKVAGDVKDEAESILDQLKDQVREAAQKVEKEAKTVIQGTKVAWADLVKLSGLNESEKNLLYKLFAKPLEELVKEKASEYDLLSDVNPEAWTQSIQQSFGLMSSNAAGLAAAYKSIFDAIKARIDTALDEKLWNARFKQTVTELRREFLKQTAAVPATKEQLEQFGKDSVTRLLQGEFPENPFSSFDFTAYFSILSDKVKSLVPSDLDIYYIQFRDATFKGIGGIVKQAANLDNALVTGATSFASDAEEKTKALVHFASDVYAGYWPRLKDAFYKLIIRPILTMIEKTVKEWAKKFLKKVIDEVREVLQMIDQEAVREAVNKVMDAVGTVAGYIGTAAEVAEQILMIKQEGEEVDSWQDGIALVIKVYGLIPEEVKEYVRDIVSLPKIDVDFHLPDYKLDVKNKFLAVKLYELKPSKLLSEQYSVGGSVSIQLLAFAGDRANGENDEDGNPVVQSGLFLYPYFKGDVTSEFNLGDTHKMGLSASTALNDGFENPKKNDAEETLKDGIGLFFTGDWFDSLKIIPLANTDAIQAWLEFYFSRGQVGGKVDPVIIYDSDTFSIKLGDYPQKAFVGYNQKFDAGYVGKLQDLVFSLDLRKENGFFEKLLSAPLSFSVDELAVGYTYQDGLSIGGSVSIRIPINKTIDLKAAKLSNMALEIGLPDLRGLNINISTNLALSLGCVHFSLSDLGFGLKTDLFDSRWHFKDFNLSPSLKLPDGMGISIDLEGAIKGTGVLKWNTDTGEVLGGFELLVVELFGASGMFILNTKPKDGVKFSFMGALTIYATIPIGMGFSITALGGSLGLFRRIDTDRMQRAVHDGTLSSVLFVKDLDKNLDTVLENMSSFYPISKENFFFGAMAEITWAEKVKMEMGLFIQAPDPVVIMIAGGLHFNVSDELDKLLSINASFLGMIDLSKGLSFDASLYDSYIVGIQFYGDIALRVYWAGDTKGFLLSAGGFHPQYKPEEGFNVSNMKRLGMKFDIGIVQLSMEEYFAVTSNTVQFGSDTRLKIGWEEFGLSGYMYYNVLFQFKPFAFAFDAGIGVSVKCGSVTLLSIGLDLEVSGPSPWHIRGKASFWFLFVKIKCSFTAEWGKKQQVGDQDRVCIISRYSESFEKSDNWSVISTDVMDNLVTIAPYQGDDLVMSSSDTLQFSQEEVPLDQDMERFGESVPSIFRLNLDSVTVGTGETSTSLKSLIPAETSFAPSLFKKMSDQDKLTAPSYVKMHSGFQVRDQKDINSGKGQVIQNDPERKTEEDFSLDDWKAAVDAYVNKTGIKPSPAQPVLVPFRLSPKVIHVPGLSEKDDKKVYRPSYRRTAEGFNRYIKTMNRAMNCNLAQMKETTEKQ